MLNFYKITQQNFVRLLTLHALFYHTPRSSHVVDLGNNISHLREMSHNCDKKPI